MIQLVMFQLAVGILPVLLTPAETVHARPLAHDICVCPLRHRILVRVEYVCSSHKKIPWVITIARIRYRTASMTCASVA